MLTATFRSMVAHKLRLLLTTTSIALGVALLAGTLILTNTMGIAFDMLFGKIGSGTDAVVRTEAPFTQTEGVGTDRGPIPEKVLATVRGVDGVRAAEGSVRGYALLTDTEGRAITTDGGAPTNGYSMPADRGLRGDVELLSGHAPHGPHQVAIDATSAEDHDVPLGTSIKVLFQGPTREFTVVGTVGFGNGITDLGGTTSAYFDTHTAQRVLGTPERFDSIDVSAEDGVSQAELTRRLARVIPAGTEAVTGEAVAKENADATKGSFRIVGVIFGIFAGIALFVGSFIIWNTFTMTVSQRSREIALLRAIGARRRQVMGSLLLEAVGLGVLASAAGFGLGIMRRRGPEVAHGRRRTGAAVHHAADRGQPGLDLARGRHRRDRPGRPGARPPRHQGAPRRGAARVHPRGGTALGTSALVGLAMLAGGAAALLSALYGDGGIRLFGLGLAASMLGVTVALPVAVRPLAGAIAAPLRLRGLPGDLAKQNAPATHAHRRHGLGPHDRPHPGGEHGCVRLVTEGVVRRRPLRPGRRGPLRRDLERAGARLQPVGHRRGGEASPASTRSRRTAGARPGSRALARATPPSTPPQRAMCSTSTCRQGSLTDLGTDDVMVAGSAARQHGWAVGDTIRADFAQTGGHRLHIAALYGAKGWISDDYVVSRAAQTALAGRQLVTNAFVSLDAGADRGRVQSGIAAALADHPDAKVLDRAGFEKEASGFIDQLLTFMTVMLALAVLIALLGIVNTLALSVFERTRELGLLRAVGMTRNQVRAMVRWESAVIALIGAVSGAVLGTGIGLAMSQVLKDEGIKSISVPVLQIAVYVAVAAAAGVLAAVGPARTAARVDLLRAVVTD